MATIYDIAKKVGVSTATVSRALNDHDDVRPETKKKIREAAKLLGYSPNLLAKSLSTKKSWSIGLMFSDDLNSGLKHVYWANVINVIIDTAAKKGYDISMISSNVGNKNMSFIEHAKYRMLDGIIIASIPVDTDEINDLLDSDIPVAMIDQFNPKATCVNSKNRSGIKKLVRHLCEKGLSKILYISGQQSNYVANDRLSAFYDISKELGILNQVEVLEGVFTSSEKAYDLTEEIMSRQNLPDVIMYSDDMAAIGGMKYLQKHGYSIPKDIAICGYDGIDLAQLFTPGLTTIKQDIDEIGKKITEELIKRIEDKNIGPSTHWVDVELMINETT